MILLAVDTALDDCAVAIHRDDGSSPTVVGEVIGRGHAEALMAMIETATTRAGVSLAEIDAFAASIGPGSFTGIRVGVAAVRGFAVATGRPALGVSSLEAIALRARAGASGRPLMTVLDARKDEVYAGLFAGDGAPIGEAMVISAVEAAARASAAGAVLAGPGSALVAAHMADPVVVSLPEGRDVTAIAAIAAGRLARGDIGAAPAPLYVRPPDAKPQGHVRLARLVPGGLSEGAR